MPPWQCGRECSGGACLDQVRDLSGPSESIAFVVSAMAAEGGTESIMDDFLRCFVRSLLPSFTEPTGQTGLPTLFSAKSREGGEGQRHCSGGGKKEVEPEPLPSLSARARGIRQRFRERAKPLPQDKRAHPLLRSLTLVSPRSVGRRGEADRKPSDDDCGGGKGGEGREIWLFAHSSLEGRESGTAFALWMRKKCKVF